MKEHYMIYRILPNEQIDTISLPVAHYQIKPTIDAMFAHYKNSVLVCEEYMFATLYPDVYEELFSKEPIKFLYNFINQLSWLSIKSTFPEGPRMGVNYLDLNFMFVSVRRKTVTVTFDNLLDPYIASRIYCELSTYIQHVRYKVKKGVEYFYVSENRKVHGFEAAIHKLIFENYHPN